VAEMYSFEKQKTESVFIALAGVYKKETTTSCLNRKCVQTKNCGNKGIP